MVRRLWLALGAALITAAGPVSSPTDQAASVAKAAASAPDHDVAQDVQDQMDAYIDQSGLGARRDKGEIYIGAEKVGVAVDSTDHDWIAQRSLAYDAALLRVVQTYIMTQQDRITHETTNDIFKAGNQEPPPFDKNQEPGQSAELIRKVLALGNAQIDTELQKLGVDPKQYAEEPPAQQYIQFQKALLHKTIRESFGSLVGLTPVQTFEGKDGKGKFEIGVVAVVSPSMQGFAQDVSSLHGEFQPDPARAQDLRKILGDKTALLHDFGVRRMFDTNGLPVIVSFYQWEPEGTDANSEVNESYREVAFSQAEAGADAQIADFLKGSAEFHDETETGNKIEKMAERLPDGYVKQDASTVSVISGMMSEMRLRSHVELTGVQTFKKWSMNHPENGHPVVGVVRVWSAAGEKGMRALQDGRSNTPLAPAIRTQPNGQAGVTTGTELMKPGDF